MVTTKGLCCTIALMCVIVPIIIGHCMPVGTEEKTGYETDNRVNITSDLISDSITIYEQSISDNNNVPLIQNNPVDYSQTYNTPIPVLTPTSTEITSLAAFDPNTLTNKTIYWASTFTFTYDGVSYTASSIEVYPDQALMLAFKSDGIVTIRNTFPMVTPTGSYYVDDYEHLTSPDANIDPSQGFYTKASRASTFNNGFLNRRVGFLIENLSNNTGRTMTCNVYDESNKLTITLQYTGAGWVINGGGESATLGNFKQIYFELDSAASEARLSALARSDFFSSPSNRILKTVSVPFGSNLSCVSTVTINESGTGTYLSRALCWDADVPIGSQQVISGSTLEMDHYYQGKTVMTEFSGVAFYGDSLQLPGMGTAAAVDNGKITYQDIDGNNHTSTIRESLLVCEYQNEGDNYDVYYDGNQIASGLAASALDVIFGGNWLLNVYIYSSTPFTYEEYIFDFTTLNVTHAELCIIGMATAVMSFVIAAFIGKRSGEKATWCLLISALGFTIWFAMVI